MSWRAFAEGRSQSTTRQQQHNIMSEQEGGTVAFSDSVPLSNVDGCIHFSMTEGILPKLIAVLELTQDSAGVSNPQARQKLLQAVRSPSVHRVKFTNFCLFLQTNNFKNAITQTKGFAINLPSGELLFKNKVTLFRCWKL